MTFGNVLWAAFLAALFANLITVLIVYALVLKAKGHSTGIMLAKAGQAFYAVSTRAIQMYIGLIVLGGIAYAVKLLVLG